MPVDTDPDPPYSPSRPGEMPEWLKGADCKSAGVRLRWFESNSLHQVPFPENPKSYRQGIRWKNRPETQSSTGASLPERAPYGELFASPDILSPAQADALTIWPVRADMGSESEVCGNPALRPAGPARPGDVCPDKAPGVPVKGAPQHIPGHDSYPSSPHCQVAAGFNRLLVGVSGFTLIARLCHASYPRLAKAIRVCPAPIAAIDLRSPQDDEFPHPCLVMPAALKK
ncbi:hypothetical protein AA0535_0093 [Asaia krungthepensis NRIC 0535]|uniref:Uncharacterized protein n=1 Tax=Asaia krungthepensis NRIC 0535 TaxID=1307925 RepID=A0ABQ0PVT1_9PROT|nr:hypothetical protein AA0535_0093 [Asaia krungthepensis NRIC 0535]